MIVRYKILQTNSDYCFRSYKFAEKHGLTLKDYKEVYESVISVGDGSDLGAVCELLFGKFNCNLPEDYKARSMSVSDIVIVNNEYYYCDDIGFEKMEVDIICKKTTTTTHTK